jgi:hypothetical protein
MKTAKKSKIQQIIFNGLRHDGLHQLFGISPLRTEEGTRMMPLIIVSPKGSNISVIRNINLLSQDDDCWVLCVWPGKKRSDAFRFQVKDFREFIKHNPKRDNQVI